MYTPPFGAPNGLAIFDSATAMVRALARFFRGKDFRRMGLPAPLAPLALALNHLPPTTRARIYSLSGASEAIAGRRIGSVAPEDLYSWIADAYPRRRYPAVALGSANGAVVHLCAALGAPWLPQTLLVLARRKGIGADDPRSALQWAREPARTLLSADDDLVLYHMHDPNQDRLMLEYVEYFRVKRRTLGRVYERFLEEVLEPGGTIVLVECTKTWPVCDVGDRHVFQMGAVGGADPREYLAGGPRVEGYLERVGTSARRWDYPIPDRRAPEAEWGFDDALARDLERFASQRGYRIRRLRFEEPEAPSPLVADLHRRWYRRLGYEADRLFVEQFMLLDPMLALRSRSVPFWTKFSVESSVRSLERYLAEADPYEEAYLALFPHGVESIGFAGLDRWRRALAGRVRRPILCGVDEAKFPLDFSVYARFHQRLAALADGAPGSISLRRVDSFLEAEAEQYGVQWG